MNAWDLLQTLSHEHALDLLPDNIVPEHFPGFDNTDLANTTEVETLYKTPIFTTLGDHGLNISLLMSSGSRRRYRLSVTIVSRTQEIKQMILEEIVQAKNQKPAFILGVRSGALQLDLDDSELDTGEDEELQSAPA